MFWELCGKKAECPICYEELDLMVMNYTPCSHLFCISCLYNLKETENYKCPLCRKPLKNFLKKL
jgi:hypothetical protein